MSIDWLTGILLTALIFVPLDARRGRLPRRAVSPPIRACSDDRHERR
jgi:hypothetical protein